MKKKKQAVALAVALLVCTPTHLSRVQALPQAPTTSHSPVSLSIGAHGAEVLKVQYMLRSFGYGVSVDGQYGLQTAKAVAHWQAANGLLADGIVGPVTWRSMGLDRPAAAAPVPTAVPVVSTPPAVTHTGVCSPYRGMLSAVGLPVGYFIKVMWRESRCDPSAYNGKGRDQSYGLLQINTKVLPGMNLWAELQWRCGLTAREQLFDPATNIGCAAKLYKVYGTRPWRTR